VTLFLVGARVNCRGVQNRLAIQWPTPGNEIKHLGGVDREIDSVVASHSLRAKEKSLCGKITQR